MIPGKLLSFFMLFIICCSVHAQQFPNMDFSYGDLSHWQIYTGTNQNPFLTPGGYVARRFTIHSSTETNDPNTCFLLPRTAPGYKKSIKLGGYAVAGVMAANYSGGGGQAIEYTFTVAADSPVIIWYYAAVSGVGPCTLSGGPISHEQFKVSLLDNTRAPIETGCTNACVPNAAGRPPANCSSPKIFYGWNSAILDLSAYIGQQVTIQFLTTDCNAAQHYYYAYIATGCLSKDDGVGYICPGAGGHGYVQAPEGMGSYLWSTGDTSRTLIIQNPVVGAQYTCTMSGTVTSCGPVTINYTLKPLSFEADFSYVRGDDSCNQIDFTDITALEDGAIVAWEWNFGDPVSGAANTDTARHPVHIFSAPGTYTVTLKAISSGGCVAETTKDVAVTENGLHPGFTIVPDDSCLKMGFRNESVAVDDSIVAITWDFGDPSSGINNTSADHTPVHVYPAPGSYPVTLTVVSARGCTASVQQSVAIREESVIADFLFQDILCYTKDTLYLEDISGGEIIRRRWTIDGSLLADTAARVMYVFEHPGQYPVSLVATAPNGCRDSVAHNIQVAPLPVADFSFSPDFPVIPDARVYFQNRSPDAVKYLWDFGDQTLPSYRTEKDPVHQYEATGTYLVVLLIENEAGCADSVVRIVEVSDPYFIPSAFSPNSDGKNDVFRVANFTSGKLLELRIVTRWGEEVYATNDPAMGWDGMIKGKPAEVGVYYYLITIVGPDGARHVHKGDLTLIR